MFFIVITFGVAYPMKRSIESDIISQSATFKSLKGFPLTSLRKGAQWFVSLSEKDRGDVTAIIINHKDKRLELLFNIATKVSLDVQPIVVSYVYRDNIQANNFLAMPIYDAYCYAGSLDILNDQNNKFFAELYRNQPEPRLKPAIICELSKEIAVMGDKNLFGCTCNRTQLEAIAKVVDALHGPVDAVVYCQYYERFTFQKFITEDLRYLPFCLSVFINFALPASNICGVNEKNVHFNKIANDFNTQAMLAHQATGSTEFLENKVRLRDEHMYCSNPFLYMKIASWLSAGVPLYDLIAMISSRRNFLKDNITGKDLFFFLATVAVLPVTERIALWSAEQPTLGASVVTGLYFLACAMYNKMIKNDIKKGWVKVNQIPELLERRNIRII